jgi:hypothetical protein
LAGSGIPSTSSGVQFVSNVTGTNVEDTLIGARQTLSGVTWAYDGGLASSIGPLRPSPMRRRAAMMA